VTIKGSLLQLLTVSEAVIHIAASINVKLGSGT